jgi:hypothetical protein
MPLYRPSNLPAYCKKGRNTIATGGLPEDLADVAWMRMMGVDSVEYHRSTVLARGDDHPG